jgi:hypothetical protein
MCLVNVDTARIQVEDLSEELERQEERLEAAGRAVSGLKKMIAALYEMFPELKEMVGTPSGVDLDESDAPKGTNALRLILQEQPGTQFYVTELVDELRVRGWLPDSDNPANAVRTAFERLVATPGSDVYKEWITLANGAKKVIYVYDPDRAPPAAYEDDPF